MRSIRDYTLGEIETMIRVADNPDRHYHYALNDLYVFVEAREKEARDYQVKAEAQVVRDRRQDEPERVSHVDINNVPCEIVGMEDAGLGNHITNVLLGDS